MFEIFTLPVGRWKNPILCCSPALNFLQFDPHGFSTVNESFHEMSQELHQQKRSAPTCSFHTAKTFRGSILKAFTAQNGISWRFNVPISPWWEGFFGRLMRSAKRFLKKTLGIAKVNYEEVQTLLAEVEGVLNSRSWLMYQKNLNSL